MRILSQDGFYDLPYDSVWLRFDEDGGRTIYAIPLSLVIDDLTCDCKLPIMAEYSAEEKAKKAMEMLHGAYCGEIYLKCGDYEVSDIDLTQEIQRKIEEEMKKPHFLEVKPNNPIIECKIFQFLADEEIEV